MPITPPWPSKKGASQFSRSLKSLFLLLLLVRQDGKLDLSVRSSLKAISCPSHTHSVPLIPHTMQICTCLASRTTDWMKIVVWHFPICLSLSFKMNLNFKAVCLFLISGFFFFFNGESCSVHRQNMKHNQEMKPTGKQSQAGYQGTNKTVIFCLSKLNL